MNTFISSIFAKFITAIMSILCLFNIVPNTNFELPPMYDPIPVVEEANENATYNNIPEFINDETTNEDVKAAMSYIEDTNDDVSVDSNMFYDAFNVIKDTRKVNARSVAKPAVENTNAAAEDTNSVAEPAAEDTNNVAEPVDETANHASEALEVIDISATEEDNLTLTLYAAEAETEAAPATFTASATRTVTYSANADENKVTVTIEPSQTRAYSEGGKEYVTAIISGSGEMEGNIYRHFVDVDKFIEVTRGLVAAEYGLDASDVKYTLPEGVTDLFEVDEQIRFYAGKDCLAGPAGTELEINDNIRESLNPGDMLKYSPTRVVFAEGSNITSISEGAFLFCEDLEEIIIPDTVKTIGANAFTYCSNLKVIVLPEGLENIEARAFMHCDSLEKVEIPATVKTVGTNAFTSCSNLSEVVLPESLESVGDEAFIELKAGASIVCPTEDVYHLVYTEDKVTLNSTAIAVDISATANDNLTLTIAPSLSRGVSEEGKNPVTVTISGNGNMGDNLYSYFVDVNQYIKTTRALLGEEYGLDAKDVKYTLPEGVTDLIEVDEQIRFYAGKDCLAGPAGTELEVTDNVREALDPSAMLKYSPTSIVFDENTNITSISEGAFLFCEDLEEIVIPNTVKTIGANAFTFCSNLRTVVLPEGLESIDARAFMHCDSLERIVLPSTVKTIGNNAFSFCSNLTEVVLNAGLESVGDEAFIGLSEGSTIICPTDYVFSLVHSDDIVTMTRTTVTK